MKRWFIATTAGISVALALLTMAATAQEVAANLVWPVDFTRITQPFGCTAYTLEPVNPHCPGGHWHSGVDLAAPLGAPVVAAIAGMVHINFDARGYGLYVTVDSGNGVSTLYGHLSCTKVAEGEYVDLSAPLGCVGSTGNSTGPHLHFEFRRDGVPEDPLLELQPGPRATGDGR